MKEKFEIKKTLGLGLPAVWEAGGGMTRTGHAQIVARYDGTPPKAVYVRRRGHLACGEHALVVVRPGMYIIEVHRRDKKAEFSVRIMRIEEIEFVEDEFVAVCDVVNFCARNIEEAIARAPVPLARAVRAAVEKSLCYHCREPHYCRIPTSKNSTI